MMLSRGDTALLLRCRILNRRTVRELTIKAIKAIKNDANGSLLLFSLALEPNAVLAG